MPEILPSVKKLPSVLYIDGLDGSGKKTVSSKIKEDLEGKYGKKVITFDPPFYDTPTGKIVKEYLYGGYGDMHDRNLASLLYTADRTVFLKEHFEEMFCSGKYDYVIMNRGFLSSLFFNTSLIAQSLDDNTNMAHTPFSTDGTRLPTAHTLYHVKCFDGLTRQMQLWEIRTYLESPHIKDRYSETAYYQALWHCYHYIRTMIIRDAADLLYRLEVAPWWAAYKTEANTNEYWFPFLYPRTVVLMPRNNMGFCINNVAKRHDGDVSQNDRNESSSEYLKWVHENIGYIYMNHDSLFGEARFMYAGYGSLINGIPLSIMMDERSIPIPISEFPKPVLWDNPAHPFKFGIVHTTMMKGETEEVQKDLDTIMIECWLRMGLHHDIAMVTSTE